MRQYHLFLWLNEKKRRKGLSFQLAIQGETVQAFRFLNVCSCVCESPAPCFRQHSEAGAQIESRLLSDARAETNVGKARCLRDTSTTGNQPEQDELCYVLYVNFFFNLLKLEKNATGQIIRG